MAIITAKLDRRYRNANNESPIVFFIRKDKGKVSIPTGIYAKEECVTNDVCKMIKGNLPQTKKVNEEIYSLFLKYSSALSELERTGKEKNMTATEIKRVLLNRKKEGSAAGSLSLYSKKHIEKYSGNTKRNYERTLVLLSNYFNGKIIYFDDITPGVLRSIDEAWSMTMGINARGIHMRNIRTIFNRAIDDEICTNYPFRTFKIKEANKEKEFLPVEYMRKIKDLSFKPEENLMEITRDLFLLSFYFCGVNLNDLFHWKKTNVIRDKIVFIRKKVAFHEPDPIKITITEEARQLMDKYKAEDEHLLCFYEKYKGNYDNFSSYIKKRISKISRLIDYPTLTFYFARYSWATYADRLEVDEKVISKSLGHADQSLAGKRYITYDWKRTDIANRKVIDYLFNKPE